MKERHSGTRSSKGKDWDKGEDISFSLLLIEYPVNTPKLLFYTQFNNMKHRPFMLHDHLERKEMAEIDELDTVLSVTEIGTTGVRFKKKKH